MYEIANEMFDLIGGGVTGTSAPAGGGTATSGSSSASCPAGSIPVAVTGNVNATIGGVAIGGNGGLATCIPVNNGGNSGSKSDSGGTNGDALGGDSGNKKIPQKSSDANKGA